jgi:hypothetical protein
VDLWRTDRRALSWCTFAFPWLALCVFAWGVQYKLSLYDPPQSASHQMPQAKLLSRQQQTAPDENPLLISSKATNRATYIVLAGLFSFCWLATRLLNTGALGRRQLKENRPWRLTHQVGVNALFRPPPALG